MLRVFFSNLIFAIIARMLCGNLFSHASPFYPPACGCQRLWSKCLRSKGNENSPRRGRNWGCSLGPFVTTGWRDRPTSKRNARIGSSVLRQSLMTILFILEEQGQFGQSQLSVRLHWCAAFAGLAISPGRSGKWLALSSLFALDITHIRARG